MGDANTKLSTRFPYSMVSNSYSNFRLEFYPLIVNLTGWGWDSTVQFLSQCHKIKHIQSLQILPQTLHIKYIQIIEKNRNIKKNLTNESHVSRHQAIFMMELWYMKLYTGLLLTISTFSPYFRPFSPRPRLSSSKHSILLLWQALILQYMQLPVVKILYENPSYI